MIDVHFLIRTIQSARISLTDEKAAQADLEYILASSTPLGTDISREHRLGDGDIPDFLVDGRYLIELKMKSAQKSAVYRQFVRYAEYQQIKAIILVTGLAMTLPPVINGKPTFVVSLGRAWL